MLMMIMSGLLLNLKPLFLLPSNESFRIERTEDAWFMEVLSSSLGRIEP